MIGMLQVHSMAGKELVMTTLPTLGERAVLLMERIARTDDPWLKANLQQDLDSTMRKIAAS